MELDVFRAGSVSLIKFNSEIVIFSVVLGALVGNGLNRFAETFTPNGVRVGPFEVQRTDEARIAR